MSPINSSDTTVVELGRTIFSAYKLELPRRSGDSQINAPNSRIAPSVFSENCVELSNFHVALNLSLARKSNTTYNS